MALKILLPLKTSTRRIPHSSLYSGRPGASSHRCLNAGSHRFRYCAPIWACSFFVKTALYVSNIPRKTSIHRRPPNRRTYTGHNVKYSGKLRGGIQYIFISVRVVCGETGITASSLLIGTQKPSRSTRIANLSFLGSKPTSKYRGGIPFPARLTKSARGQLIAIASPFIATACIWCLCQWIGMILTFFDNGWNVHAGNRGRRMTGPSPLAHARSSGAMIVVWDRAQSKIKQISSRGISTNYIDLLEEKRTPYVTMADVQGRCVLNGHYKLYTVQWSSSDSRNSCFTCDCAGLLFSADLSCTCCPIILGQYSQSNSLYSPIWCSGLLDHRVAADIGSGLITAGTYLGLARMVCGWSSALVV